MEAEKKQLLQELCHLYLYGQFDKARDLITHSAAITPEEKANIAQGGTGDFILRERTDSYLHKMIEIERAFYLSGQVLRTDVETGSERALQSVENLEKILPYAYPEEQIYIKHQQARCYRYAEMTDDEQDNTKRYMLYREVFENCPLTDDKRDEFLKFWAKEINDLDVSPVAKYEALKSAQNRSSDYGKCAYKKMLAPLAEVYVSCCLDSAKNSDMPFSEKIKKVKQAKNAVDDIDVSQNVIDSYIDNPRKLQELRDVKKHKYELSALGLMKKIYQDNGNEADAKAICLQIGKMQNLFYAKYPWLKNKGGRDS